MASQQRSNDEEHEPGESASALAVQDQAVGIESLPLELLLHIFDYSKSTRHWSGDSTFRNLSLVNKTFRSLCMPRLFRTLRLNNPEHELTHTFGKIAASAHIVPFVRFASSRAETQT